MTTLVLRGGTVLLPDGPTAETAQFTAGEVYIREGVLLEVGSPSASVPVDAVVLDVAGLRLVPGFIDLQVNGLGGIDLCSEPERLVEVARMLPQFGVTSFLPTLITSSPTIVERAMSALAGLDEPRFVPGGARPLGLHLEGPMLAPERKGAHPPALLRAPSNLVIEGWTAERGVALVTIAPELNGAIEVVRALVSRGIRVFAGHTNADVNAMHKALDAGVVGVTHLFNTMPGLGHRAPGPVGVALTDRRVTAGVIVDGVHVDPMVVNIAFASLTTERLALVSDAVAAAAMPSGTYALGGVEVATDGVTVRLRDGTLAGSVLTLDKAIRNLSAYTGCSFASAVRSATATPARVLGRSDLGVLRPGALADVVAVDDDGCVVMTVVGGRVAFDRRVI